MNDPKEMTVAEAGKRGGDKVKAKYGTEFYEAIGRKGGEATKKRHGREFYERIGKLGGHLGGDATKARFGPEHYAKIGKKGGAVVRAAFDAWREKQETEAQK